MSSDCDGGDAEEDVLSGVIGALAMVGLLCVAVLVWWLLTVRPCPTTWLDWPRSNGGQAGGIPTLIEE